MLVCLACRQWLKPNRITLTPLSRNRKMPKPEKQWTRRNGVIIKKPVGWSTRDQVKRHKELKHNLNTAPTTSEEYTYEDYSVSPDTDDSSSDTSCAATTQYEVTDEAPPQESTTTFEAKAVFHMEHVRCVPHLRMVAIILRVHILVTCNQTLLFKANTVKSCDVHLSIATPLRPLSLCSRL